jgi:NAD-dependent deacetylase
MKNLVVLSGAGMSAESGIPTFRGADGLWEGYRIDEVATPYAWEQDFRKVLHFYNERRRGVLQAKPNRGHDILAELESLANVHIITQNIDNLHERAGSSKILHLHGEITKSRSTKNSRLIYDIEGTSLNEGDLCAMGSQLRPHIVWFHEEVPMMEPAISIASMADVFLIVGTSLQVYPASGLVQYVKPGTPIYVIDPSASTIPGAENFKVISEGASVGMEKFRQMFLEEYGY